MFAERPPGRRVILPDKLVAFVDRSALRQTNTAVAAWSGAEQTSRSTKALTFPVEPIIR